MKLKNYNNKTKEKIKREIYETLDEIKSKLKGKSEIRFGKLLDVYKKHPYQFVDAVEFMIEEKELDPTSIKPLYASSYRAWSRLSEKLKEPGFIKNPNISCWIERRFVVINYPKLKGAKVNTFRIRAGYKNKDLFDILYGKKLSSANGRPKKTNLESIKKEVSQFLNDIKFSLEMDLNSQNPILKDIGIDLRRVYIENQLTAERIRRYETESLWSDAKYEVEKKYGFVFSDIGENTFNPISWEDLKKHSKKIMVLAGPGMGKTSLLRIEGISFAQLQIKQLLNNEISINKVVFPIFLHLKYFANSNKSLSNYILEILEEEYGQTYRQIENIFRRTLRKGNCFLLFDGLDRVPAEKRGEISERLKRFFRKRDCQVLCASRIAGYNTLFPVPTRKVMILPFYKDQIKKYVKSWIENAKDKSINLTAETEHFLTELPNNLRFSSLAKSPQLLSFLCSLSTKNDLSIIPNRSKIYDKIIRYMLKDWRVKTSFASEFRIPAKIRFLENLAFYFSKNSIHDFEFDDLVDWFQEKKIAQKALLIDYEKIDSIISELSIKDGFLTKGGIERKKYSFCHKTFQEFFAASYLKRVFDKDPQRAIEKIRKLYWDVNQHELIIFFAGLLEDPRPVLKDLLNVQDDIFNSLLMLAGMCVAECEDYQNAIVNDIIDKIYNLAKIQPFDPKFEFTINALVHAKPRMLEKILRSKHGRDYFSPYYIWYNIEILTGKIVPFKASEKRDRFFEQVRAKLNSKIRRQEVVDKLIRAFKHSTPSTRQKILNTLGKLDKEKAFEALKETFLNDNNISEQEEVGYYLYDLEKPKAISLFIEALKVSNYSIRERAVVLLGKLGGIDIVNNLEKALDDWDQSIRMAAACALGRIGGPKVVKVLSKAMENGKNDAYHALSLLRRQDSLKIIEIIKHRYDQLGYFQIQFLGRIGGSEVVKLLEKAINEKSSEISRKVYAIIAMGEAGGHKAVTVLKKTLKNDDILIRQAGSLALGMLGKSEGIDNIIDILAYKGNPLEFRAWQVLEKLGKIEILEKLIKHKRVNIFESGFFTLARNLAYSNRKVVRIKDGVIVIESK